MGCQSEVAIGDWFTFAVTTHDPTSGALTDADAAPAYRIYEDETGTAILTGTMAKLDDGSTTGFYSERVQGSTANGFETGKSYSIYITAAVGGVTGAICYALRALTSTPAAVWAYGTRALTQTAAAVAAAISGDAINILRGDTVSITITGMGDISSRTRLYFTVKRDQEHPDSGSIIQIEETDGLLYLNGSDYSAHPLWGTITVDDAVAGDITIVLTPSLTTLLEPHACYYDVEMIVGSTVTTLTQGQVDINPDTTGAIT